MHPHLRRAFRLRGMEVKKYRIRVEHKTNGLSGMVEVISTTRERAELFALQSFFRGGGWTVTDSRRVHDA